MKEKSIKLSLLIPLGISLLAAIVTSIVLTFALAGVAFAADDPFSLIRPFSLTALAIGALVCGIVSARTCDGDVLPPILSSLISGVVLVLLILLVGLVPLASTEKMGTGIKTAVYLGTAVLSTVGGVIGTPKLRKRPPYPRKRRR